MIVQDIGLPTGGTISVPANSSTLNNIVITTANYADAGSGIASNVITRSNPQAPTIPGVSCPAGGYSGSTVVTSPDTVATDGMCYVYTLTGTDNVGNAATVTSSPILVDTSTVVSSGFAAPATTITFSVPVARTGAMHARRRRRGGGTRDGLRSASRGVQRR